VFGEDCPGVADRVLKREAVVDIGQHERQHAAVETAVSDSDNRLRGMPVLLHQLLNERDETVADVKERLALLDPFFPGATLQPIAQYRLVDLPARRIGSPLQDTAVVFAQRVGDLVRHAPRPGEDLRRLDGAKQWAREEPGDGSSRETLG